MPSSREFFFLANLNWKYFHATVINQNEKLILNITTIIIIIMIVIMVIDDNNDAECYHQYHHHHHNYCNGVVMMVGAGWER